MRLISLFIVIFLAAIAPAAAASPAPNIVVVMTDDQNDTGDMAIMHNTLRALADHGVTFTNSFTNFSLCCPSRASFLTGQAAHNHGITDNRLPYGSYKKFAAQEDDNLGVWLQAAGYHTGFIGKFMNAYAGTRTHPIPGWNDWRVLLFPDESGHYFGFKMNENGIVTSYGSEPRDYVTDVITRQSVSFIEQSVTLGQPFFLYVGHHAPHEPATPAPRYDDWYNGRSLPRRPNFNESDVADKPLSIGIEDLLDKDGILQVAKLYRHRLETLLSVDDSVHEIMETLRRTGALRNTYVIFTSDNGFTLGEHRHVGKRLVYEESLRVPLIMYGPDIPSSVTLPQLVNNLDVVATIVDLSGAIPSHPLDGVSLHPLMLHPHTPWRTAMLVEGRLGGGDVTYSAVRTIDSVYVEYQSLRYGREIEFYNLVADPYQLRNAPPAQVLFNPCWSVCATALVRNAG